MSDGTSEEFWIGAVIREALRPVGVVEKKPDIIDTGPRNVRGRLREWARIRHWEPPNAFPARSPNGKIADEQENAGIHGEGLAFDVIDGVTCRPDGGMAAYCEKYEYPLRAYTRARQMAEAIRDLPPLLKDVICARYDVPKNERPRSFRLGAEKLNVPLATFERREKKAIALLAARMDLTGE